MNKIKRSGVLILSGFLLSACGVIGEEGAPEDLEENWTQYIQEGNETLDSYASDTQMDLELALGPGLMTEEDEAFISMQIVGDLEQGYTVEDDFELYFDGEDAYQLEGGTWVHYPGSPIEYDAWYPNIVDSLIEIDDLIEATHNEDNVELTYEGNDVEVWEAFEEEFALTIEGISQENIHITLDAVVDDSEYYLQDLNLDIEGAETEGDMELSSISIFIEVDYFDHNNVDLTEVEEEIAADVEN